MHKIKALMHMAAVFSIFFLADAFSATAFLLCSPGLEAETWYICLHIASVWIAASLYAKYVLKIPGFLQSPAKAATIPRWCIGAAALPAALDIFYLVFVPGTLQQGVTGTKALFETLYTGILSWGLRSSITEEILFRRLALCPLQKELGEKKGLLLSALFASCTQFAAAGPLGWQMSALFLFAKFSANMALALAACQTGSIRPCIAIHALFLILFADSPIFHIAIEPAHPAVWIYTPKNSHWFFTGIPGIPQPDTAFPAMIGFGILIAAALMEKLKKKKGEGKPNGTLQHTDH